MITASAACAGAGDAAPDGGGGSPAADATPDDDDDVTPRPDGGVERVLRVMTFNIDHGATASLAEVADVISSADPDVVALLDVDVMRARSGGVDQSAELATLTGLNKRYYSEATYPDDGYSGDAFLYRHELVTSAKILLPGNSTQQRILGRLDVEVEPGLVVKLALTHLTVNDASERLMQAQAIADELTDATQTILLGDMSDVPTSDAIAALLEAVRDQWPRVGLEEDGLTYPASSPDQRTDYVFASDDFPTPQGGKVVTSSASDHLPVLIELVLP